MTEFSIKITSYHGETYILLVTLICICCTRSVAISKVDKVVETCTRGIAMRNSSQCNIHLRASSVSFSNFKAKRSAILIATQFNKNNKLKMKKNKGRECWIECHNSVLSFSSSSSCCCSLLLQGLYRVGFQIKNYVNNLPAEKHTQQQVSNTSPLCFNKSRNFVPWDNLYLLAQNPNDIASIN